MRRNIRAIPSKRRGAVGILFALLALPLVAMLAFAVDYGFLLKIRTDLQRTADAAALAAVQSLIPAPDGTQDFGDVENVLRDYAVSNRDSTFQVLGADIEMGRYDPATIYSNISLLQTGTFDTVRVTVRNDASVNAPVSMFFAKVFGVDQSPVTATACAVLQKARFLEPGTAVLPFVLPVDVWNAHVPGDTWSIYGDGKMKDANGDDIPGNWGTLDIGPTSNGASELSDQILNGLKQSDIDALHSDGRIASNKHIDGDAPTWMQGDPGLSTGIKNAVQQIYGQTRLVPIYDQLAGQLSGNNVEIKVIGWGVVQVVDSDWNGAKNTHVTIKKAYMYDGDLRPNADLGNTTDIINAAYTSPILVE